MQIFNNIRINLIRNFLIMKHECFILNLNTILLLFQLVHLF